MFIPLIPSSPQQREARRAVHSWALALLGHGTLCAAAVWGTLRPRPVSAAGRQPVVITWPQPDQGGFAGGARSTGRVDVTVPVLPTVDLSSITPLPVAPGGAPAREPTTAPGAGPALPAAGEPWSPALVEEPPVLLAAGAPRYPDVLRAAGISGRVVIEIVIDTLGRAEPGSAVVVESANPGFDDPARRYILGAQFRPARVHGRAVRVLVRVPIDFKLAAR